MGTTRKASRKVSMTLAGTRSRRAVPLSAKAANYKRVQETLRIRKLARGMKKLADGYRRGIVDAAKRAKQQQAREMSFVAAIAALQRELSDLADNPVANNANVNALAAGMAGLPVTRPLVVVEENAALPNFSRFSIGR